MEIPQERLHEVIEEQIEHVLVPQSVPCSIAAVEASASRVVGSLPLLDEFTTSMHQEQFADEHFVHVPLPQNLERVVRDPSGSFS